MCGRGQARIAGCRPGASPYYGTSALLRGLHVYCGLPDHYVAHKSHHVRRRHFLCRLLPEQRNYVAVDASGTFSETKRQTGLLRMLQAGVIVSDYATLMVEILKDNARPEAGAVYGALDMPWATLVGQVAQSLKS